METKVNLESDETLKAYWCGNILDEDHDGYQCVQLYLDETLAKNYFGMVYDDDSQAILQIYATSAKTTVIKRDTDIMTKEEEKTHWKELQAAMLEELKIWVKYRCFHMRLKHGARNIMDSKNVLKWKWIVDEQGHKKRIIRCREPHTKNSRP